MNRASDGVAIERNLFPEALSAIAEETENSLCTKLAGDENQGPEKTQPPHDGGLRESSPPAKRLRRIRLRGTPAATRRENPRVALVSCSDADVLECENW